MTTATTSQTDWLAIARDLGRDFAPRAAAHDADDSFVAENYDLLKAYHIFAAPVPQELGGGGNGDISTIFQGQRIIPFSGT